MAKKKKRKQRTRMSCLKMSGVLIGVLVGCGCCSLCLVPILYQRIEVEYRRWQWNRKGVDDYSITLSQPGLSGGETVPDLPAEGRLDVCDGKIVRVDDIACDEYDSIVSCDLDPIDAIFRQAPDHLHFPCWTKYHDQYDFPVDMGCYFIEGAWIEITEFQEIDCPLNGNPP